MNYLTGQEQLFVALQLHAWSYCLHDQFARNNSMFSNRCVAYFWN